MISPDVPQLFKISKIPKIDLPRCTKIPKIDLPKCINIPRFIQNYPKLCNKASKIVQDHCKIH